MNHGYLMCTDDRVIPGHRIPDREPASTCFRSGPAKE